MHEEMLKMISGTSASFYTSETLFKRGFGMGGISVSMGDDETDFAQGNAVMFFSVCFCVLKVVFLG